MNCPKCGHEASDGAFECERCGVIFAKVSRAEELPYVRAYGVEEERVEDGRIGPKEWKILGFGLAAAVVAYAIPADAVHPVDPGHAVP